MGGTSLDNEVYTNGSIYNDAAYGCKSAIALNMGFIHLYMFYLLYIIYDFV